MQGGLQKLAASSIAMSEAARKTVNVIPEPRGKERKALLLLYTNTGGDAWRLKEGWMQAALDSDAVDEEEAPQAPVHPELRLAEPVGAAPPLSSTVAQPSKNPFGYAHPQPSSSVKRAASANPFAADSSSNGSTKNPFAPAAPAAAATAPDPHTVAGAEILTFTRQRGLSKPAAEIATATPLVVRMDDRRASEVKRAGIGARGRRWEVGDHSSR